MSQEINLLEVVHREFIQPEIARRKTKGELPEDFQIRECLIKLPGDSPPIVLFNDEFGWTVKPKLAPGIDMQTGYPVYLHEVEDIEEVMPPMIDGKRVSFIYLFWGGYSYSIIVDTYHPTLPNQSFTIGETIADHLRTMLREKSVRTVQFVTNQKLREIGLWSATSLLSYPMSKIVECIGRGNVEEARQVLVEYCDSDFLARKIVQTWQPISVFRDRTEFFNDALFNHQNKRYHGSISILVGQIEGVITDWLFEIKHYNNDQKRSLKTKIIDPRKCSQPHTRFVMALSRIWRCYAGVS